MRPVELIAIYLFVGAIVAFGIGRRGSRGFAFVLWPLILPGLLARPGDRFETTGAPDRRVDGPIRGAIDRLQAALDRWHPEPGLSLAATEVGLSGLEVRRRELSAFLARPENARGADPPTHSAARGAHDRRMDHLASLQTLHDRLEGEIAAALARIDELATRIRLAHFRGQPLDDVARQLGELCGAVEGLAAADAELE